MSPPRYYLLLFQIQPDNFEFKFQKFQKNTAPTPKPVPNRLTQTGSYTRLIKPVSKPAYFLKSLTGSKPAVWGKTGPVWVKTGFDRFGFSVR